MRYSIVDSRNVLLAIIACCALFAACDTKVKQAETTDAGGLPKFHRAARTGDVATVRQMLKAGVLPDLRDADGVTALHRAARDGKLDIAQVLLDANANTNLTTSTGWTPLQLAVKYGRKDAIELLLRYNADIDARTPDGFQPLTAAIKSGNDEIVHLLLADWPTWAIDRIENDDKTFRYETRTTGTHTANVNVKDGTGVTPLWAAVDLNNYVLIDDLLSKNADVNEKVLDGKTVLHLAVEKCPEYTVKVLLDHNANPAARDDKNESPYTIAQRRGDEAIMRLIWDKGGRP